MASKLDYCMGCGAVVHNWPVHVKFHQDLNDAFETTGRAIKTIVHFLGGTAND